MSNYFKIDGNLFPVYLTVDTTQYTADSTLVTADTTIEGTYPYLLRTNTAFESNEFQVFFKNEITKVVTEIEVLYYYYSQGKINVYFDYTFLEGDSFEITIKDISGKLMRRTKGYATIQDDLENLKLIVPNNNGVKIMK